MKVCAECKQSKSVDDFRFRSGQPYRHSYCRPCEVIRQQRRYLNNIERERTRSREYMRQARTDPDKSARWNAAKKGAWSSKYGPQTKARVARTKALRFFYWRWTILANKDETVTPQALASLWRQQHGRCALSGKRLGRDAHLDHIVPKARGGQTTMMNLQWVVPEVNYAKRNLTVDEFATLCSTVAEWLGHRLMRAETLQIREAV